MSTKLIQLYKLPSDVLVLNSSGELFQKSSFVILNRTKSGYVFIFSTTKKNLKAIWLFPNYYNSFLYKDTIFLFRKKKFSKQHVNSFLKYFYKGMLYFYGFNREILHFVGVGYKIHYFRRRHKFKIYIWVGYCTWQIVKLVPKTIRKRDHESFRLMSLRFFSRNQFYFKKMVLIAKNIRLSEPYKGKGIRHMEEKILRKPGKTGRI